MAHINLLPWREEAERIREQQFYTILAVVAFICVGVMFAVGQLYQARVDGQVARNNFLKAEIKILDGRIDEIKTLDDKKTDLQSRINVIENLQRSRNLGTEVLDELAKIIPNGVHLISISKQNNQIDLMGKSESNNHLANMIRNIEKSNLFTDPILESITTKDAKRKLLSDFKMQIQIKGLVIESHDVKGRKS